MTINQNSLAAGNLVGAKNTVFQPGVNVLARKILIIGCYDETKVGVVENVPVQVLTPEAVGDSFGFGFMVFMSIGIVSLILYHRKKYTK